MPKKDVKDFLSRVADSAVKLELIAYLVENPYSMDNSTGLAKWLNLSEAEVHAALVELAGAGLVTASGADKQAVWSFEPDSPLAETARQAARAYRLTRDSLREQVLELERTRFALDNRYAAILSAERGKTETILNSLDEAVVVTGREASVLMVNGEMLRRFSEGREAVSPGSALDELFVETGVAAVVRRSLAGLSGQDEIDFSHGGRAYHVRSIPVTGADGAVLRDGEGESLAAVTVFRDVTRDREIERMREDFISMLTHDLVNPLGIIYGSTTLVASGKLGEVSEKQKRLLSNVIKSCGTMERLIQDFLTVARLEAGKLNLNPEQFDVNSLIRDILQLFGDQMRDRSLALTFRAEYEPGLVQADPVQLERVLTNLVGNAVKYNRDGGNIIVSTVRDDSGRLCVTVEDDGPGIPEDELPVIFDRFQRSSTSGRAKGSGLGLAVVRQLVTAMDGEIQVRSHPGEGACFSFRIPVEPTVNA